MGEERGRRDRVYTEHVRNRKGKSVHNHEEVENVANNSKHLKNTEKERNF